MIKTYLAFFVAAIVCSSCSKSNNPVTPAVPSDSNIYLNHQLFEVNGNPSLNGWTFHPVAADDTLDFEQDVPQG
ncbi:MAG: hypothetical protein ACHQM6_11180, partial [Candidatus Kapaibacterium sp.]